ncbi:hypothetical protein Tco_1411626 [Tanacetum coccineum]
MPPRRNTSNSGTNRENQLSHKTSGSCDAKEFFGTEGAVGLLSCLEGMQYVLHKCKCPAKIQVEIATCMLQGRALTWRNNLVQARGRAAAIALPWEDLKKLLMEEYCPNNVV